MKQGPKSTFNSSIEFIIKLYKSINLIQINNNKKKKNSNIKKLQLMHWMQKQNNKNNNACIAIINEFHIHMAWIIVNNK